MNTLTSLNSISQMVNEEKLSVFEKEYGHIIHHDFREILLNYNVAKPKLTYFKNKGVEFNLNYLLGFSENKAEDFLDYYQSYLTRIPDSMLAIGSVDGGDLLCLDNNSGEIYYWFHEENDWGLEGNIEYPTKVSSSLNAYLESLIASETPTKEEIAKAVATSTITITPQSVKIRNEQRAKQGLPSLTIEEWYQILNN